MCDLCLPSRRWVLKGIAALPLTGAFDGAPFPPMTGRPDRSRAVTVGAGLEIRPRADWAGDDRPPTAAMTAEDVRFLLVHHTAGSNDYTEETVPQLIRNIYDFHTGPAKRWPDVAYNFLIDRYGGVWEARAGALAGAVRGDATGGNQGYSQLVSLMGDFSVQSPTGAALDSLVATLAWLADRHRLDTNHGATTAFESWGSNRHPIGTEISTPTITGHRAMSQTSCPGDALFGYVEGGLMADVTARRSAAPATTDSVPTTAISTTTPPTTAVSTTTTPTELPTSALPGPVSSLDSAADSVDIVTAPPTDQTSGGFSLVEGVGLAGAGLAAAVGGLLLVRSRTPIDVADNGVPGQRSGS